MGESLLAVCRDEGMPDRATVYRWRDSNESFRDKYAQAQQTRAAHMFDDLLEIADEDESDVQRSKLRVETRKWILARMDSKNYGDKIESTLKGDPSAPLTHQHTFAPPASPEARAKLTDAVQSMLCGDGGED